MDAEKQAEFALAYIGGLAMATVAGLQALEISLRQSGLTKGRDECLVVGRRDGTMHVRKKKRAGSAIIFVALAALALAGCQSGYATQSSLIVGGTESARPYSHYPDYGYSTRYGYGPRYGYGYSRGTRHHFGWPYRRY